MGLQTGRLNNRMITASSQWDNYHAAFMARLNWNRKGRYMGAWSAKHNNRYQYLQINFGKAAKIIRIATQGRADADQWVTQYYCMHSLDGIRFVEYKERNNRRVGVSQMRCHFIKSIEVSTREPRTSCFTLSKEFEIAGFNVELRRNRSFEFVAI